MNNAERLYLNFDVLYNQKRHADYIRYFATKQTEFKQQPLSSEQKLLILYRLGESFVFEKNTTQAKKVFTNFIKLAPTDTRAYLALFNILKEEKNWQELIEVCQSCQTHCPNLWQPYWQAGHAYKELYEYDKAQAQFEKLIELFPNQHHGYEGLVNVAQHQKNHSLIIERATTLQEKFPNMWLGYWVLGHVYKEQSNYKEAEKQFNALIAKLPNDHRGYEGLVNVAQHQKNHSLIIERATTLQEKFPNMWLGYWVLGHVYKELYEYDKAQAQFEKLVELFPNKGQEAMAQLARHRQNNQS